MKSHNSRLECILATFVMFIWSYSGLTDAMQGNSLYLPSLMSKSPITENLRGKLDNVRGMSPTLVGGSVSQGYCLPQPKKIVEGSVTCLKKYWRTQPADRKNVWESCRSMLIFSHCTSRLLKLPADVLVVSRNLLHMVDGNPRTIWSRKVESQPTEIQIALDSKYKVFGIELKVEAIPASIKISLKEHHQPQRTVAVKRLDGCDTDVNQSCGKMPRLNVNKKTLTILWKDLADVQSLIADSVHITLGGDYSSSTDYTSNYYIIREVTVLGLRHRQEVLRRTRTKTKSTSTPQGLVLPRRNTQSPQEEPLEMPQITIRPILSVVEG